MKVDCYVPHLDNLRAGRGGGFQHQHQLNGISLAAFEGANREMVDSDSPRHTCHLAGVAATNNNNNSAGTKTPVRQRPDQHHLANAEPFTIPKHLLINEESREMASIIAHDVVIVKGNSISMFFYQPRSG